LESTRSCIPEKCLRCSRGTSSLDHLRENLAATALEFLRNSSPSSTRSPKTGRLRTAWSGQWESNPHPKFGNLLNSLLVGRLRSCAPGVGEGVAKRHGQDGSFGALQPPQPIYLVTSQGVAGLQQPLSFFEKVQNFSQLSRNAQVVFPRYVTVTPNVIVAPLCLSRCSRIGDWSRALKSCWHVALRLVNCYQTPD